ncbi:MAG: hypothetical protein WA702_17210 [Bradyrhizobium sp.]
MTVAIALIGFCKLAFWRDEFEVALVHDGPPGAEQSRKNRSPDSPHGLSGRQRVSLMSLPTGNPGDGVGRDDGGG